MARQDVKLNKAAQSVREQQNSAVDVGEPSSTRDSKRREIKTHKVNACNDALHLFADENSVNAGGAPRTYVIDVGGHCQLLTFHSGDLDEGPRGLTHELLLAVSAGRCRRPSWRRARAPGFYKVLIVPCGKDD